MLILFVLALFITVSNVSAADVTVDSVANASETVKSYVETNHTLPSNVNISGNQVNMSNYLGLSTTAILNINNSSNAPITIKSFGAAPDPSETVTTRTITKAEYLDMAESVRSFMDREGRAPNWVTQTSTGNTIRYENMIYMFSQILSSYKTNGVLPDSIIVKPWTTVTKPDVLGSTDYGYVEKKFYGNQSSDQTIVLIIGVHPQENGIHTAIYNAIVSKSAVLSKRYVLYYVHVTQDADDYSKGRMNGQLLAQEFIVPDVASENPMLVLDNHENHGADSGYAHYWFLYPISKTAITTTYANEIISHMSSLVIYYPPNPTSPQYVTVPIANKGIPTIIYEVYMYDSTAKKASDANSLINALDSLNKETTNSTNLTVTASPAGGTYYSPQNVTLNANETSKIYYTLDGTNPTKNSAQYSEPITIGTSKTLKFTAWDSEGNQSPIYTEKYLIYKLVPYSYTVKVAYKKGWYKYWYTVKVKKRYKSWYKYKGKWKYKWQYKWTTKSKYKWKYGWLYKNVVKYGTKWMLT